MEERNHRSPKLKSSRFAGVGKIVRFNWHFYLIAGLTILTMLLGAAFVSGFLRLLLLIVAGGSAFQIALSLTASHVIYDRSRLAEMGYLDDFEIPDPQSIAVIHAGFDEASARIRQRFPGTEVRVYDFYDPKKHTEVSIRRARKVFPPDPNDISIETTAIPEAAETFDLVFLILAAHEIRDCKERTDFLSETRRVMREDGGTILVEHLRDLPNFLAFSVGFLHFISRRSWEQSIARAQLTISEETRTTPFITAFQLTRC